MMLGARLSAYAGNLGTRGALAFVAPSEEAAVVLAKRVLNLGKSSDRGASAPHHAHERAWRPAVLKSMSALPAMTF